MRERNEARQLAEEKKAAGFRTALVESERENLFTLSLGNVQPGDIVMIQLKYFQTLRSLAGMPSIEVPFCPGIRYIPGKPLFRSNRGKGIVDDTDRVPDASRITPVRIDAEHPDAAFIDVRGTLDGKFIDPTAVTSPSHPIIVQRTGEEVRVTLADKSDVPDRDFVLRWSEKEVETVAPRVWMREKGSETYALMEIRAPKVAPAERSSVDFYFLVDRSGSMAGIKWKKAAQALQSCVKVLGPNDRAMVTFFETQFQDYAELPLPIPEILEDKAFRNLKHLGTGGGTELYGALEHVLEVAAKHSADRCRNLILITDAQIGNESAILDLMKTAPDFPVHCFGIDVALNDSLLLALCRQQGGTFHSLNPRDDIEQSVTALGKTLGQPVLLDLQLSDDWEIADARIPNLYAEQVHYLSARSTGSKPLELTARSPSSETVKMQFEAQNTTVEAPYLHWCKSRINRLVAESNEKAAIALSIDSNLICPLTAFIAWDESEKVPIATHNLVQPSLTPQGMLLGKSFAAAGYAGRSLGTPAFRYRYADNTEMSLSPDRDVDTDELLVRLRESTAEMLKLKRELSDICHRKAVPDWEPLVKAIFDDIARKKGGMRLVWVKNVSRFIEELKQKERDEIHAALKAYVDALPAN